MVNILQASKIYNAVQPVSQYLFTGDPGVSRVAPGADKYILPEDNPVSEETKQFYEE
jgi:hypothetical protein